MLVNCNNKEFCRKIITITFIGFIFDCSLNDCFEESPGGGGLKNKSLTQCLILATTNSIPDTCWAADGGTRLYRFIKSIQTIDYP